ncbi:DUF7551 domain-containing protein [Halopiger djelfimassiliensis]|uniref:DUF7551 domain-containing protein n=1 Tax=Halopiger djelfimassiliensis TaxID=1293047 RepID=UPI000677C211|nr:hypothetical protein [Halopiger djelfimassiliensis]
MVGTTLREIRHRIEQLATDDGDYYVICGRTGEFPVPVAGKRFPTRKAAADAARATEQYRAALRRYDPQAPFYEPIVCQRHSVTEAADLRDASVRKPDPERSHRSHGSIGTSSEDDTDADDESPLISFCHDVSGAVFEALSARDHAAAETAIMDTYLAAAEAVTDRDALCLVLLETMATELGRHLTADERGRLLRTAAANLSPVTRGDDPVEGSLSHLRTLSLIGEYDVTRSTADAAWTVSLHGYAIESDGRRFPMLPIGIDMLRRTAGSSQSLGVADVTALGDGDWELVVTDGDSEPGSLVCTGRI